MRVLFLSLLLVNVAFFAWEYRHPEPPPAAVARLEPGVPPVRLLRERAAVVPTGKAMPAPGAAPAVAPGAPSPAPKLAPNPTPAPGAASKVR